MSHTFDKLRLHTAVALLVLMLVFLGLQALSTGLPTFGFGQTDGGALPASITTTGTVVCVPLRGEPQPLAECVLGIYTDDGQYMVLHDQDANYRGLIAATLGVRVTVEGDFVPKNDLRFNSVGILSLNSLRSADAVLMEHNAMLIGTYVCLPAPEGEECKDGLHVSGGTYYELDIASIAGSAAYAMLLASPSVVITGTLAPSATEAGDTAIEGLFRVGGVGTL